MGVEADVRHAIVAIIQQVPNVGNVYDRYKYSSNWQSFLDQFMFQDSSTGYKAPRGWWVNLPTAANNLQGTDFDEYWDTYTYPIRGILGVSDAADSENSFDLIIWQIRDTLRNQGVLGNGAQNRDPLTGYVVAGSILVDVPIVEIRAFGSTLCHYCEMRMQVGMGRPVVNIP